MTEAFNPVEAIREAEGDRDRRLPVDGCAAGLREVRELTDALTLIPKPMRNVMRNGQIPDKITNCVIRMREALSCYHI